MHDFIVIILFFFPQTQQSFFIILPSQGHFSNQLDLLNPG